MKPPPTKWAGPGVGWTTQPELPFRVGDIVTRGDGDRHVIEAINDAGDLLDLRCIVGCAWCQPGDLEANLASRYEHAGEIVEGSR